METAIRSYQAKQPLRFGNGGFAAREQHFGILCHAGITMAAPARHSTSMS
jgi:hypothetical protein